jgi:hypothetical protein
MVKVGTSRAAKAPSTRRWNTVILTLKAPERNPESIINLTFSVALSVLPNIHPASAPLVYGISEGLKFVNDVNKNGLEEASKHEAISLTTSFVAPYISQNLWNIVQSKADPAVINTPFGSLAELAFKKTMNQIMAKGADALMEEI